MPIPRKEILAQFLEEGVTHIADRGYISFKMLQQILAKRAFFVFRMKSNWKYTIEQSLEFTIPACGWRILTSLDESAN